jgi:hypothetical protein
MQADARDAAEVLQIKGLMPRAEVRRKFGIGVFYAGKN